MIQRLRFYCALALIALLTLILLPVQVLSLWGNLRLSRKIPLMWHKMVARIIGFRVHVKGALSAQRPLLLVANHVSWSDIVILASVAEVCFIAKKEVSEIPFAGFLARLQRSVFVTREEKRRSGEQAKTVANRLLAGDVMVLFAEGTTNDGNSVLEFKSSLFGAAQYVVRDKLAEEVFIQPVSIAYTHCHGLKMGRLERARISWPGDLQLPPHAKDVVTRSAWDVEVTLLEPIRFDATSRRQTIAGLAREQITDAYRASVFGR